MWRPFGIKPEGKGGVGKGVNRRKKGWIGEASGGPTKSSRFHREVFASQVYKQRRRLHSAPSFVKATYRQTPKELNIQYKVFASIYINHTVPFAV